jgi:hypothetical protein
MMTIIWHAPEHWRLASLCMPYTLYIKRVLLDWHLVARVLAGAQHNWCTTLSNFQRILSVVPSIEPVNMLVCFETAFFFVGSISRQLPQNFSKFPISGRFRKFYQSVLVCIGTAIFVGSGLVAY